MTLGRTGHQTVRSVARFTNFQNVFKPKGTLFKQNESISQKKNIGKLSSSVRSSVVVKKLRW